MEKWVVTAKRADFKQIAGTFGIDPVIARLIRNRDIVGDEAIRLFLYGDLKDLHDPFLMKDMDKAVDILKGKIREQKKIRVIGDYDIDGVMSSYILKRGLTELGADADVKIPNRVTDGYGINEHLIREAFEDGIDTIVTCDNGISAGEQIRIAKDLGMTVVVTDHHDVLTVPEADAVIDVKQSDDNYPYRELCGAAVAWKLILAMGGDPDMHLLEYVAFATIGDVVDLTGENRILVREGLKRLRCSENKGIQALARACGIPLSEIGTYHIGYVLGPCLNASGRLDTAMRAFSLLLSEDEESAALIAGELKDLNDSRKALTESGCEDAERAIAEDGIEKDKVYVIYLPDLHESLAGIVAGRIRERYNHPVFVLTRTEEGVKGSGRSIEAYSMFESLVGVREYLTKFGGHPMAAGLSMPEENVEPFRRALNEACTLTDEDFVEKIKIDVPMPAAYVSQRLVEQISYLEPFGKANPAPVFADRCVRCEYPRLLGAKGQVLKIRVRSMRSPEIGDDSQDKSAMLPYGYPIDAVCFRNAEALEKKIRENPDRAIVYYPQINEYMGTRKVQIVITHFQA